MWTAFRACSIKVILFKSFKVIKSLSHLRCDIRVGFRRLTYDISARTCVIRVVFLRQPVQMAREPVSFARAPMTIARGPPHFALIPGDSR